jgi:UDP-N-acetylglucosamine--N-acetylmuramyl-(pentapeptide) pyrophosphoryl-undecaprenol N-acetylglucosamine transferase
MRILIAAGGTGGHIYHALAVVARLAARRPDLELRWLGGHRGLENVIVPEAGFRLERLWLRSLRSVDVSANTLLDPLRLLASLPQAGWAMLRRRPDAIYTTGGYVAIPVLLAAALLRIPSLLWEGNQVPGRSVRFSARLATARAVSFAATRDRLPAPTYVTGTPIRPASDLSRDEAAQRLGIPPGLPVLLVFGGSQSVRRLDEAMADAAADLVQRCVVVHITGTASYARAEALRDALPTELRERYRPFAFLHEDMAAALAAADLLVGRAGSSSLAEAAAAGLPMIVVPYPHAAAHQRANAAELVQAGGARLVDDAQFDGDALRAAADLLAGDDLGAMAAAARSRGRPGAATVTADLLLALATRAPLPDGSDIEARTQVAS